MSDENELLNELQRLHRRGLINDQEAIDLKKLLKKSKDQRERRPNSIEKIERLEKKREDKL